MILVIFLENVNLQNYRHKYLHASDHENAHDLHENARASVRDQLQRLKHVHRANVRANVLHENVHVRRANVHASLHARKRRFQ